MQLVKTLEISVFQQEIKDFKKFLEENTKRSIIILISGNNTFRITTSLATYYTFSTQK